MNRNDIVKLSDLLKGDRFYKASDGKKKAMAVRTINTHPDGSVKSVYICDSNVYDHAANASFQIINKPAEYTAVFLRNNTSIA